jgi:hypothetical protein
VELGADDLGGCVGVGAQDDPPVTKPLTERDPRSRFVQTQGGHMSPEYDHGYERDGPLEQWELWELVESDGAQQLTYFPSTQDYSRRALDPRAKLIWTVQAFSYEDAMQKKCDFLGWGKYKAIPNVND